MRLAGRQAQMRPRSTSFSHSPARTAVESTISSDLVSKRAANAVNFRAGDRESSFSPRLYRGLFTFFTALLQPTVAQ